jgi:hypothetical protein
MKRIARLAALVLATVKRHKYQSLVSLLLLAAIFGLVTTLTLTGANAHPTAPTAPAKSSTGTATPASKKDTIQTAAETTTEQPATNADTPRAAAAPTTAGQKNLIISPGVITVMMPVVANTTSSTQSITIQSGNGKGINMPGFMSNPGYHFLFNFPAGPAKPTWSGQLSVRNDTPVGIYNLEIFGQDVTEAYYKATITINVLQPTMNVSVQSLGYDAENDGVAYILKTNRAYGFSEPITEVAASSSTEPGLICAYSIVDDSNIALGCGHDSGSPATSGTLTIEVSTASLVRTITTSYSLPASP